MTKSEIRMTKECRMTNDEGSRCESRICTAFAVVFFLLIASLAQAAEAPIALHPENPHYLMFRGKPTILITSTEHYGAVLNADFDYVPYLEELQSKKLNLTR